MKWNWLSLLALIGFVALGTALAVTRDSIFGLIILAFGSLVWAIGTISAAPRLHSIRQRWVATSYFVLFLLAGSAIASAIGEALWSSGFLMGAVVGGIALTTILHLLKPKTQETSSQNEQTRSQSLSTTASWILTTGLFIIIAISLLPGLLQSQLQKPGAFIPTVAFIGWVLVTFVINNTLGLVGWFKRRPS